MKKLLSVLVVLLVLGTALTITLKNASALTVNPSITVYGGNLALDKNNIYNIPIDSGDTFYTTLTNNTSCTITIGIKGESPQVLTVGQTSSPITFSDVTSNVTVNVLGNNADACSGMSAQETAYPGSASLGCSESSTTRTITGSYTNFISEGAYLTAGSGGTPEDIENSGMSGSVNEEFSSDGGVAQTYYFYDSSPGNPGALITTVNCPAYSSPTLPSSGGTSSSTEPKTTTTSNSNTTAKSSTTSTIKTPTSSSTVKSATNYVGLSNTKYKDKISGTWLGLIIVGSLLITLLYIVTFWKVFTKAGRPGWAAIIPVYNYWVLYEIGDFPGWWAILYLIPIINIAALIIMIMAILKIGKKFGKSTLFTVFGLIIFSFIGWPILAFSKVKYSQTTAVPKKDQTTD